MMNKNKKIFLYIITIFTTFMICTNVKAATQTYCKYKMAGNMGLEFYIIDNNGNPKLRASSKYSQGYNIKEGTLDKDSFYNDGEFTCPRIVTGNSESDREIIITSETSVSMISFYRVGSSTPNTGDISQDESESNGTSESVGTCDGLLGSFKKDLENILKIMRILAPLFVAIYTVYDYITVIIDKDAEKMKKVNTKFFKRLILMVVLFLLPTLLNLILGIVDSSLTSCID